MVNNKDNYTEQRAMAGNIPVFCAHDAILPLDDITPNPSNPNTHPTKQIKLLGKIIEEQGWRAPIVISSRSNLVVKGHGRLLAAYEMGMGFVPIEYQHYDSAAAETADMVADNKIAEFSELDEDILHELLKEMNADEFDLSLTGFDEEELDNILTSISTFDTPEKDPSTTTPEQNNPKDTAPDNFTEYNDENMESQHKCPKCGFEW